MNKNLKNVLLIEDSREMQAIVRHSISDVCLLKHVGTAAEGRNELDLGIYSLLLLDVSLPDADGFEFCASLRKEKRYLDLPVIFLTGKTDLAQKVQGFEAGGDDYITKPFEPEELRARVKGKLSRIKELGSSFSLAGYRVDFSMQKIFEMNEEGVEHALPLTPLEFKIFSHLLKNSGKVFSRKNLLELFWADSLHISNHTVDTHISSLRKKMGERGGLIRSVFKQGYTFEPLNESQRDVSV
ncbi:response regulator transcription factor [Bdellovibrio sp. HCB288]|uniref:response regulator transcription factor n=1 Tax=Bdellovibrio sp. HCB288 TaxID=3394355 RepID=UPI0039B5A0E8